jgi:hypothetical protein
MATNGGIVRDPFNQADDWFELFNSEPVPVDLSGYFLTDNLSQPTKFQIPNGVIIPAYGFLVFWADNTPAQGPTHTNFALSASGESLGLFAPAAENFAQIDAFSFGPMASNEARGRLPDGTGPPTVELNPTPGTSNVFIPVVISSWEAD